jgi:hypothetical protein
MSAVCAAGRVRVVEAPLDGLGAGRARAEREGRPRAEKGGPHRPVFSKGARDHAPRQGG